MKGFPNQVSDLATLGNAVRVLRDLVAEGKNAHDDGVYGEALIRRGVLGTGHTPVPVEEYLASQKAKQRKSDQSYRTRARGLRELFRVLNLIADTAGSVVLMGAGQQIAALADTSAPIGSFTTEAIRLWRTVILSMTHDGGDGESSHPYQVLVRLVAKRPGITRAKCALALEAKNDSDAELDRIVRLADLEERHLLREIGVSKPNWDNAKKILPRFAEQLGDVQKIGHNFYLSDAPGVPKQSPGAPEAERPSDGPRKPRSSSSVHASTIARAATEEDWDEGGDLDEPVVDPGALKERRAKTRRRLNRHNLIVQRIAKMLEDQSAELYEMPFDCLACFPDEGLLIEVKTLDGSEADQIARVRDALAQLLYYESFVTKPLVRKRAIRKVACFEDKITDAHIEWLRGSDILVIWAHGEAFDGAVEAKSELSGHFGF